MPYIEILKILLEKLGGDATVQQLGKSYSNETKNRIDLKVRKKQIVDRLQRKEIKSFSGQRHGCRTFVEYLKLHSKYFEVYRDNKATTDYLRVRLIKTEKPAEASKLERKDFNAWQMPPPAIPPLRNPLQMSAPKQKLEWLRPEKFIRLEQQRASQSSPSIQSVASADFRDGFFTSSTPLPPEPGDVRHELNISQLSLDRTESSCNRSRRQIKSWTPQELAKLKMSQRLKEEKVEEQTILSDEFENDDTLSIPELVSMYSIGSLEDIKVSLDGAATMTDRSATIYEPQEDSDSSDGEHYEDNVYEMMKSISCSTLDITLCTENQVENTELDDYSYERLDTYDDNSLAQTDDISNCAAYGISRIASTETSTCDAAGNSQAKFVTFANQAAGSKKAELQMDTIEFASETIADPDATIVDPLQFIATLRLDDDFYLAKFPEVILDPSLQLEWQEVPKSGEIDIFISEVYSPQHFWFQYTQEVEELMDTLDEDYFKLRGQQLMVTDEKIVPGLLVAVYLPDFERWHRAKVIRGVNSNDEARLLLLDYGTVGNIKKHHIRFLFKKFLAYPRYSHRGRFENLKPSNGEKSWNEQQVTKFLVKTSEIKLQANVVKFHENERVFELDITLNKNSSNPVNLRKWLIDSWLCESFVLKPGNIYPMCYYFPCFDMLEKNHPAFHKKSVLLTQGIDFDLLVETNYFENVNEETLTQQPRLLSMLGNERFRDAKKYYFNT